MSRVVPGLGIEPDIRAARMKYKNDPKGMRNFRRRLSSFRRAEKFQDLINKLRGRNPKKGTPRADRIAERIKRLEQRKDRNLERSRYKPDKTSGSRDRGRKSTVTDDGGMGPKNPPRGRMDTRINKTKAGSGTRDRGVGPKNPPRDMPKRMPKPISRRFAPGERRRRPMPKPISRRRLEDERRRVPRRG